MPGLPPAERLRRFLTWLLPTTADALALERSRVLMSAESEAHFDVQNFFDTRESAIRALIEQYIAPLVSPPELQFYVDLLRVIQNGVVLSAVEHPGYWTEEKQLAFIDSLGAHDRADIRDKRPVRTRKGSSPGRDHRAARAQPPYRAKRRGMAREP
ncbi:MAG TPA: hypothetical protein VFW50_43315 [Streptosporangiaceae bacterium]|nr:hypothetical protein [Streptosporangiaceae bacterium]